MSESLSISLKNSVSDSLVIRANCSQKISDLLKKIIFHMFPPLFMPKSMPKSESLFTQSHFAKELREWFDLFHEEIAILLKKIERFTWKTERIPNPAWNKICSLICLNVKN